MKEIYEEYLIDYRNGEREVIPDLKTFYGKYRNIKKNNKMETVARWCGVDRNMCITPLSEYGLRHLFLWATEPETGGFVVIKYDGYYFPGGITQNLKNALIYDKEDAERIVSFNPSITKMMPCSVVERDAGCFNNK